MLQYSKKEIARWRKKKEENRLKYKFSQSVCHAVRLKSTKIPKINVL